MASIPTKAELHIERMLAVNPGALSIARAAMLKRALEAMCAEIRKENAKGKTQMLFDFPRLWNAVEEDGDYTAAEHMAIHDAVAELTANARVDDVSAKFRVRPDIHFLINYLATSLPEFIVMGNQTPGTTSVFVDWGRQ